MSPSQSLYGKVTSRQVRLRIFYQLSSLPHLRASAQPRITRHLEKVLLRKAKPKTYKNGRKGPNLKETDYVDTWKLGGCGGVTY